MAANQDEPRPTPFTQWVAAEPLALIFGIVALPGPPRFNSCFDFTLVSGRIVKPDRKFDS